MSKPAFIVCAVLAVAAAPALLLAQTTQKAVPTYRPGLGDMMTMTVQPRHIKLGIAGRAGNWAYAAYELHELEEAFDRAGNVWPVWRTNSIPAMVEAVMTDPVARLREAVKAGDGAKFAVSYRQLTEACNICHESTQRGVIVVQEPAESPYSDQDFRPRP